MTNTARRKNCILSRFLRGRALRSPVPVRVGRPAGGNLVGTCAGDGKVEIYDMLRPPGTNTPSTFRGDEVCSYVLHVLCVSKHGKPLRGSFFSFFWTRRVACNSRQLERGLGAWATTAGNISGDVEAWHMAPKILLGICMGASKTSFFTTSAVPCSRHQSIDNRQSSGQSRKMAISPIPQTLHIFYMRGCVLLPFVAVCFWCVQVVLNGVIFAYLSCVLSHLNMRII